MKDLMKQSLIDKALEEGGRIEPLIIPSEKTGGLGLCIPSIFKLEAKDKYLVNVRNVSYYLHHCEGEQKYQTPWGPLNYVRPDNDPYLRTDNYLCEFSLRNQVLSNPRKVDTSELPIEPEWDFVGLEDARIVKWDDKMYLTGVIRHAPDGKGRMVLSEIVITKKTVKEVNRFTIEPILLHEKALLISLYFNTLAHLKNKKPDGILFLFIAKLLMNVITKTLIASKTILILIKNM